MSSIPLDLNVEVRNNEGGNVARWDSNANNAGDRPTGISFRTKRGDGFADASCTLARRIDGEYVDLGLLRDIKIVGADGTVAYEGRITGLPRSMGAQHSVSVQAAGWMSHAKDRKFREIYVDRDLSHWTENSRARQVRLYGITHTPVGFTTTAGTDRPSIQTAFNDATSAAYVKRSEAWYDAGPVTVGAVYWDWNESGGSVTIGDTNWFWAIGAAATDDPTNTSGDENTGNLRTQGRAGYWTMPTVERYVFLWLVYNATSSLTDGARYVIDWRNVAVYGSHGLTRHGDDPGGFYVSDMIRNIASRWAPMLDTRGVQDTTYPVEHCVFADRIYPYDAWTALNAYHLWSLSVWEHRVLTFAPVDLTDYDWEIRLGDPGVEVDLQGDSTADLANGIAVSYTDVSNGRKVEITPDDFTELADLSVDNPANEEGLQVWTELDLSFPVTQTMALQLGRAALAEFNRPKAPGTIKAKGYIRDRAGHLQPVWKVRADDRVSITNFVNDRPRLIVETDYNHDSQTVSISVDAPAQRLDAVLDRITSALGASGLS